MQTSRCQNLINKKISELKKLAANISSSESIFPDGKRIKLKIFEGTQLGTNNGYFRLDEAQNKLYYIKFGKTKNKFF